MTTLNVDDTPFEYDSGDPEGFRAGRQLLRNLLGATKTGLSVWELPPGQAMCPYHYEFAEEEWLLVLEGTPTLRTPDGESVLRPMDVAFFPTGPAGAHSVRNHTDSVVRALMFSDVIWPAATIYPDSDKVGVWAAPGGKPGTFPLSARVDYFDGEV